MKYLSEEARAAIRVELGRVPDVRLAVAYGVTPAAIRKMRRKAGIAAAPVETRHPTGRSPQREVIVFVPAEEARALTALSPVERAELTALLGIHTDHDLAVRFKLRWRSVRDLRRRAKIANPHFAEVERRLQHACALPMGDTRAARVGGVSYDKLRAARKAAGIRVTERESWLRDAVLDRLQAGPATRQQLLKVIRTAAEARANGETPKRASEALRRVVQRLTRRQQIVRLGRDRYALPKTTSSEAS